MSITRPFEINMLATNVVAAKENYTRQRGKIIEATEKHTNFSVRGKKQLLKSKPKFSFSLFSCFLEKV